MASYEPYRIAHSLGFALLTGMTLSQGGCSSMPWHHDAPAAIAPAVAAQADNARSADGRPPSAASIHAAEARARRREAADLVAEAMGPAPLPTPIRSNERSQDGAVSGLVVTVAAIDQAEALVTENLRNADTTAFKTARAVIGEKAQIAVQFNMEQGSLASTGRNLDVGIQGEGFFAFNVAPSRGAGIAYGRAGNFFVNAKGEITLGVGDDFQLQPRIAVPNGITDISISQDGLMYGLKAGTTARQTLGQMKVYRFNNPEALRSIGGSLFVQTPEAGPAVEDTPGTGGSGQLLQGFLEESNVDLTREQMRLRFLQTWRDALVKAGAPEPTAAARPAAARALGR
jgi:flagellar basal body rod protein FlgG